MKPDDVVTVEDQQVVVLAVGPDGWIKVLYPDGDEIWTPRADVTEES